MKRYELIAHSCSIKFSREINSMLDNGWELYGYLIVENGYYYQTMIKEKGDAAKE